MYQSALAIYAAKSADEGDASGVINSNRWEESIKLATGGIEKYRGKAIVLPYGYTYSQFSDELGKRIDTIMESGRLAKGVTVARAGPAARGGGRRPLRLQGGRRDPGRQGQPAGDRRLQRGDAVPHLRHRAGERHACRAPPSSPPQAGEPDRARRAQGRRASDGGFGRRSAVSLDLYERETADRIGTHGAGAEPEAGAFDGFMRGAGLTTMRTSRAPALDRHARRGGARS
jgi:hypothetical protein